jgi:hypothetical protein
MGSGGSRFAFHQGCRNRWGREVADRVGRVRFGRTTQATAEPGPGRGYRSRFASRACCADSRGTGQRPRHGGGRGSPSRAPWARAERVLRLSGWARCRSRRLGAGRRRVERTGRVQVGRSARSTRRLRAGGGARRPAGRWGRRCSGWTHRAGLGTIGPPARWPGPGAAGRWPAGVRGRVGVGWIRSCPGGALAGAGFRWLARGRGRRSPRWAGRVGVGWIRSCPGGALAGAGFRWLARGRGRRSGSGACRIYCGWPARLAGGWCFRCLGWWFGGRLRCLLGSPAGTGRLPAAARLLGGAVWAVSHRRRRGWRGRCRRGFPARRGWPGRTWRSGRGWRPETCLR